MHFLVLPDVITLFLMIEVCISRANKIHHVMQLEIPHRQYYFERVKRQRNSNATRTKTRWENSHAWNLQVAEYFLARFQRTIPPSTVQTPGTSGSNGAPNPPMFRSLCWAGEDVGDVSRNMPRLDDTIGTRSREGVEMLAEPVNLSPACVALRCQRSDGGVHRGWKEDEETPALGWNNFEA